MALTTKSTSGCVATRTVPACPCTTSMLLRPSFLSCWRTFSASCSLASERTLGFQRRASLSAASVFEPAAIVNNWNRSGLLSITLSVLRPMEPVEPRMAMRYMKALAYQVIPTRCVEHDRRDGEEECVNSVKESPVARKECSRVLEPGATLQRRFKQIAELRGDI